MVVKFVIFVGLGCHRLGDGRIANTPAYSGDLVVEQTGDTVVIHNITGVLIVRDSTNIVVQGPAFELLQNISFLAIGGASIGLGDIALFSGSTCYRHAPLGRRVTGSDRLGQFIVTAGYREALVINRNRTRRACRRTRRRSNTAR